MSPLSYFFTIGSFLLWGIIAPWAARGSELEMELEVVADGRLVVNGFLATGIIGIAPPRIFELLEGRPPHYDNAMSRSVWYSYRRLGVLVTQKFDIQSDYISVILPSSKSNDFPLVIFTGRLIIVGEKFNFTEGRPLHRADFQALLDKMPSGTSKSNYDGIELTFPKSTVCLDFDPSAGLTSVNISYLVSPRKPIVPSHGKG